MKIITGLLAASMLSFYSIPASAGGIGIELNIGRGHISINKFRHRESRHRERHHRRYYDRSNEHGNRYRRGRREPCFTYFHDSPYGSYGHLHCE